MHSYGPLHMAEQKQDDQLEHTCSSSVRIRDVALKTCQRRRTIGRSGERGSGISVLAARHDDDDDDGTIAWCLKWCKNEMPRRPNIFVNTSHEFPFIHGPPTIKWFLVKSDSAGSRMIPFTWHNDDTSLVLTFLTKIGNRVFFFFFVLFCF